LLFSGGHGEVIELLEERFLFASLCFGVIEGRILIRFESFAGSIGDILEESIALSASMVMLGIHSGDRDLKYNCLINII
jgi:hypothetical protein